MERPAFIQRLQASPLLMRARRRLTVALFRALGWLVPVKAGRVVLVYHSRSGSNTLALMAHPPEYLDPAWEIVLVKLGGEQRFRDQLRKLWLCAGAQVLVTTHRLVAGELQAFPGRRQTAVELWHGFPLKGMTLMEPALSPREKRKVAAGWAKARWIASYSPLYNLVLNACYGVDINQYVITGAPRNDWLFSGQGRTLLEWVLGQSLGTDQVVGFLPTFRHRGLGRLDGARRQGHFLGLEGFDAQDLGRFLEREALQLVMKIHPMEEAELAREIGSQLGGRIHLLTDAMLDQAQVDLYQVLPGLDALVTDYSGVCYDYLLLDRPMVFTPVDLDAYRGSRNLVLQPYEFWTPGPKAVTQPDFQRQLSRSLADPGYYQAERALVRRLIHTHPDGQSSARVWALIRSLLQGTRARP